MTSACSTAPLRFDATLTVDPLSQLAGVLAGFVFAGLIVLMQDHRDARRVAEGRVELGVTYSLLASVFVLLVVGSYLYASAAGEMICSRAAAVYALASVLLATGGVGTVLSIAWLMDSYAVDRAPRVVVSSLTIAIALLAAAQMILTLGDAFSQLYFDAGEPGSPGREAMERFELRHLAFAVFVVGMFSVARLLLASFWRRAASVLSKTSAWAFIIASVVAIPVVIGVVVVLQLPEAAAFRVHALDDAPLGFRLAVEVVPYLMWFLLGLGVCAIPSIHESQAARPPGRGAHAS